MVSGGLPTDVRSRLADDGTDRSHRLKAVGGKRQGELVHHGRRRLSCTGERQQSSAEQLHAGAPVHLSPERPEAVDVPFHRTIAPAFSDGAFDGTQIVAQFSDEALQGVNLRRTRRRHPLVQGRQVSELSDCLHFVDRSPVGDVNS